MTGETSAPVDPATLTPSVHAAQEGDEGAFRLLYRTLQPLLLRYLQTLVGSDAEDVAAEAWLQISRDLRTFQGDWDKFRGWSVTIARHRAMDHLRHQRRRPAVIMPVQQLLDVPDEQDTAERAEASVATDEALAMIAGLPRDQAEAVFLRVLIGLDAQTCGEILGKRAGAVRTAAYRGLRQLAQQLDPALSATLAGRRVTSSARPALKEVR
jgi:RNA polymerase sigma-70 factor, ECF subfamily